MTIQTGKLALEVALEYERQHGRRARRVRGQTGYDLESDSRRIEVKGSARVLTAVRLSLVEIQALFREPDWHLYLVTADRQLYDIPKGELISRLRPEVVFKVKFSPAELSQWQVK